MRYLLLVQLMMVLLVVGCNGGSGGNRATTPSCLPLPASGSITVTGTVRYEDIEYAESGWTGKIVYKPVRHVIVDLLDSCGTLLTSGATDNSGAFLFSNLKQTVLPATIRVMAESEPSSANVVVQNLSGAGYAATYSLVGMDLTLPQGIDISKISGIGGVFNMFDLYQSALEFAANHASTPLLPLLKVVWEKNNTKGTYTCDANVSTDCPQGMGIYVLNTASDQDEYDDDVLWHEFTHFVEYAINATDSPGGMHMLTDNDLDLRLAWSEGHADYLQSAIKRWLRANHPERLSIPAPFPVSWYIDTDSSGLSQLGIDIANPGGVPYLNATNEVAVANALWHGSESYGALPYWDAFAAHLPTVNDGATNIEDNLRNLEAYWDGLLVQLAPLGVVESSALSSLAARAINYASDAYEPDDAPNTRTSAIDCASVSYGVVCINENHTLYRGSGLIDEDIVPFSVSSGRSYTITTNPMANGLDSYLEVLATDGRSVLASNDDALDCATSACSNNGFNYSSRLNYTPSTSGTLYVRVRAVPYYVNSTFYRGWGAGTYGGYTLTVTAN